MSPSPPIPLERLAEALKVGSQSLVSLVGGGGKTTLLLGLARHLAERADDPSVIVTTTTKMSAGQHGGLPLLFDPDDDEVQAGLAAGSPLMIWDRVDGSKAVGVDPQRCDHWGTLADHVLVEADGSRRRPFKAPGPLEPEVPRSTTDLVSVIGIDAVGRVILDQCHRPLRVAGLAGCQPGERLTPERAATVLLHPRGMRRAQPSEARFHVVITKVNDSTQAATARLVSALTTMEPDLNVVSILDVF